MVNNRQRQVILIGWIAMATILAVTGCQSVSHVPTVTKTSVAPMPLHAQTVHPVPASITPVTVTLSTFDLVNTPTPQTNEPPRWKLYESALAKAILPKGYRGLCEWEILGQQKNEVYVWALCASSPAGAKGSVPAVIVLNENGGIQEVKIPGDGDAYSQDIRKWFPPEVQKKIFHFHSRLITDEAFQKRFSDRTLPPQIVVSGTPLP